jgi:hypothetical protein
MHGIYSAVLLPQRTLMLVRGDSSASAAVSDYDGVMITAAVAAAVVVQCT